MVLILLIFFTCLGSASAISDNDLHNFSSDISSGSDISSNSQENLEISSINEDLIILNEYSGDYGDNIEDSAAEKDGMLQGPSVALYSEIMREFPSLHLIASGGVSSMDDIRALDAAGVPAVVFGKALYEGKIKLEELNVC